MTLEVFLKLVGNISDFAGILGLVISFFIWLKLRRQEKKIQQLVRERPDDGTGYEELVEYHRGVHSERSVAFCVSLTDNMDSIKQDVEGFLVKAKLKMGVEEYKMRGLTQENFREYVEGLKAKRLELSLQGVTEVHLFVSGPIQAVLLIGAVFSNWIPVKIYNFNNKTREYEYWGPLIK